MLANKNVVSLWLLLLLSLKLNERDTCHLKSLEKEVDIETSRLIKIPEQHRVFYCKGYKQRQCELIFSQVRSVQTSP